MLFVEQNNVRHDAMWYWRVKGASDRLATAKVMNPAIKRLFEVEVLLPALFHPRERNAFSNVIYMQIKP